MKLERYEVRGFCHFTKPFSLNLVELPQGLIAVVGPNGAGKTSLALDAPIACLYGPGKAKAFPSRDGTLATYATERDAYIDTDWVLEGRGRFRARVNVDGVKRKVDAVLEEIDEEWIHRPINDGKVETFIDAVAERFPSLRSLLASAYAAQNKRGGFGELGQRERMELFVELADLAHYEQKSRAAKRCADVADIVRVQLRAALDTLRRGTLPVGIAAFDERLQTIEIEIGALVAEAVTLADRRAQLTRERLAAHADADAHVRATRDLKAAEDRAAVFLDRTSRLSADLLDVEALFERRMLEVENRLNLGRLSVERRADDAKAEFERGQKNRRERIANNKRLQAQALAIQQAVDVVLRIETREGELIAQIAENERERSAASEHRRECETKLDRVATATIDLESARRRSGLLGTVKFGDACAESPACPLVTDAIDARETIADLEAVVATKATIDGGVAYWSGVEDGLAEMIKSARREIASLGAERTAVKALAAQAPYLDAAQARIDEYERDEGDALDAFRAIKVALAGEIADLLERRQVEIAVTEREAHVSRQRIEEESAALARDRKATASQLSSLRADVERLSGAKANLDRITAELDQIGTTLADAKAAHARLEAERGQVTKDREALRQKLAEAADVERRLRLVEDHYLAWQFLADACGRNGLQRLEIDAAGPVVSDLANQLLRVGYGTRFSVDIVTQIATADGKDTKEKFTILTIDNAHGGEPRDIGDLSGGEKVVVEEAVRAALACYVNMRSRTRFRTLFRDETTGALDPENAPKYVAMLRKMLEMSGAEQCLFITHSPECAALADAQVRVSNGEATVALPPYLE